MHRLERNILHHARARRQARRQTHGSSNKLNTHFSKPIRVEPNLCLSQKKISNHWRLQNTNQIHTKNIHSTWQRPPLSNETRVRPRWTTQKQSLRTISLPSTWKHLLEMPQTRVPENWRLCTNRTTHTHQTGMEKIIQQKTPHTTANGVKFALGLGWGTWLELRWGFTFIMLCICYLLSYTMVHLSITVPYNTILPKICHFFQIQKKKKKISNSIRKKLHISGKFVS